MSTDGLSNAGRRDADARRVSRRGIVRAGSSIALGAALSPLADQAARAQGRAGGARTLILASHPYPERSVVNRALWEVARKAEDASFRNLETVYGGDLRGFDAAAERRLYATMARLVLIFPTHWFNLTPMLKAYLNEIWGAAPPAELRGKELLVVTTTGGDERAYARDGRLGVTIDEVLTPLRASARYCGMTFSTPLAFFGVLGAGPDALRGYQDTLAARLREEPRKA